MATRTMRQVLDDPKITDKNHIIILDGKRTEYEARGFAFVENLAGPHTLMRRPTPKVKK